MLNEVFSPILLFYSFRLSAFVLKTLSQARTYIYVDNNGLERTKSWIVDTQRPDGSFESVGRIINKEIQVYIRTTQMCIYIVLFESRSGVGWGETMGDRR